MFVRHEFDSKECFSFIFNTRPRTYALFCKHQCRVFKDLKTMKKSFAKSSIYKGPFYMAYSVMIHLV